MNQYEIVSIALSAVSGLVILYTLAKIYAVDPSSDRLAKKIANVHVFCGVLHIVSALALGWVAAYEPIVWEAPVYNLYALWQNSTVESCTTGGRCYVKPVLELVDEIPVAIFAVLFGIISGYTHLLSVAFLGKDGVSEAAQAGNSAARWLDYFFSASLMV